jgi:hypothetical protein
MLRARAFSYSVGLCVITNRIPELGLHQLREISAQMHQFAEISALDNAALLEDPDHVRIPNGRQAVGDDEGGAPLFQVFESLLQRVLSARRRCAEAIEPRGRTWPLAADGKHSCHLVAFVRGEKAVALAPRRSWA